MVLLIIKTIIKLQRCKKFFLQSEVLVGVQQPTRGGRGEERKINPVCFLQMSLLPDVLAFLKAPQKEQLCDSFVF